MQPEPAPEPEPEEEMDEDGKAVKQRRAEAQREKEAGNAAYKARQFEAAIQHYDKAIELDDSDISFLTNRCSPGFCLLDRVLSILGSYSRQCVYE